MSLTRSVVVNIIGRDNASASFLRVSKAADKAANSADRAILRFQARAAKLQAAGQKMSKSITLPLLALGAVSIDQAAKFQKSLTVLNTATGESVKNLDKIGSGVKKIAVDTGTSLGQLTDGMYLAEKAGFSLSKGGLTVLKAAAQGAKAENVDLSIAMTALTSIMTSYGLKAKDAVGVENELIVGSGLAKTTMTDFANSLSNVVPLAAGLHISFAQVAGAIATMTQHGESAQRATENLSNLLTNLAGSNNVATTAMQQLGIDTVDLQKNLGKRGLTGSLDIVLNALKKHGHAGIVVYDTFRKSSLATKSLREELGKMTGPLKEQSKAFLAGKEGYADYQKFFRSLGGRGTALGSQFAASVKSFLGFNNLVRQGRGDRQTYAKWLQQALGGVTGLKAMLMLLGGQFANEGASAGSFAGRVKEVAKAAHEGGKDVHGFGQISKTASFKFDQAKEKLQVLSETIGEKLLPYAVKIVTVVGKIVDKFDNLSGTQKKIIGWGLVVIGALGPVLAIAGRVGFALAGMFKIGLYVTRFVKGIAMANVALSTYNTAAFQSGLKVRAGLSRGVSAARGLSSALIGLGAGLVIGNMTKAGSTAEKVGGVIASAGIGAAAGWQIGGPWGAAIGGLVGGLTDIATAFSSDSDAAKVSAAKQRAYIATVKQEAEDYLSILDETAGAYDRIYKAELARRLSTKGIFDKGEKLGLSDAQIMDLVTGKQNMGSKGIAAILNKLPSGKNGNPDLNAFLQAIGPETDAAKLAEKHYEQQLRAQGKAIVSTKLLAQGAKGLNKEFVNQGHYLSEVGVKSRNYTESFSAGAMRNTAVVKQNVAYLKKQAVAAVVGGKTVGQANAAYGKSVTALHDGLIKLGFDSKDVNTLFGKLHLTLDKPTLLKLATTEAKSKIAALTADVKKYGAMKPSPKITAKIDQAEAEIQRLQTLLANLRDKQINLSVNYTKTGQVNAANPGTRGDQGAPSTKKHKANGGPLGDGYFTVGERGWELGYKRGNSVMIYDNKTSQKMTGWNRVPGFAGGTSGTKSAAKLAQEAKDKQSALSQKVSDVLSKVGQPYSAPFDTSQVGLPRLAGQIATAIATLRAEVAKGLKKSLAEGFAKQIKALVKIAEKQLAAIRLRIKKSDLDAISKGLKSSVDEGKTAYDALLADMKAAGASASQIAKVRANESAALANDKRLLAAKDYRSSISDTLRGAFDSTQYGSVEDLLTGLGGATSTNNSYARELSSLRGRAKGNKGLLGYINQLAASGQTATLQTLYGANGGELNQVSKAVSSYNASVAAGSDAAEVTKFGESINTLVANQDRLASALAAVAHSFLKDSAKPTHLTLHVNGKEIAAEVVHSKEFDKELAALLDAVVNHHTYKH